MKLGISGHCQQLCKHCKRACVSHGDPQKELRQNRRNVPPAASTKASEQALLTSCVTHSKHHNHLCPTDITVTATRRERGRNPKACIKASAQDLLMVCRDHRTFKKTDHGLETWVH